MTGSNGRWGGGKFLCRHKWERIDERTFTRHVIGSHYCQVADFVCTKCDRLAQRTVREQ